MSLYHAKSALSGLWKEKWIYLLSTLSMAVGLFVMSVGFVAVYNMHILARELPEKFSMTVYLKDGLSADDMNRLKGAIGADRLVSKVTYISKDDALDELRKSLKGSENLLDGLDNNPLPASFEVKLKRKSVEPASVGQLAKEIRSMQGVDDIQYGQEFLDQIQKIVRIVQTSGLTFLAALLAGVLFVCYTSVKILFYRKADEVETLKLLGATGWFIRVPFLLEGVAIGVLGGAGALAASFAFFKVFIARFGASMPVLANMAVPSVMLAALPLAGLFIGFTGALIALGRIRF